MQAGTLPQPSEELGRRVWGLQGATSPFSNPGESVEWAVGCSVHQSSLKAAVRPSGQQGAAEAQTWRMQEGGRGPAPDRVEGDSPFVQNQNSRKEGLEASVPWPSPGRSPLPVGSTTTFSLLLPRPAEVTAATHSRYGCPRVRWAIR